MVRPSEMFLLHTDAAGVQRLLLYAFMIRVSLGLCHLSQCTDHLATLGVNFIGNDLCEKQPKKHRAMGLWITS